MCSTDANEAKLFAKTVPLTITDAFSRNERSLFLSIEWLQTSTVMMKKELFMSLTDNNDDPFFLYNLLLSEDDYQRLRSSQNLLVDFSAFPQKVIYLLELCLSEAKEPQPVHRLHLTMGETNGSIASTAQLDIEQSSVFKQVSLLSLKFLAATESTVKQHMTTCFRHLKEEKNNLQKRLCCLEENFKEQFSACKLALEKKTQELDSVKDKLREEINKRENEYTHTLREEREKFLIKQQEGENRLESERKDRETKLKNEISQLELKVSGLEALNKEMENRKAALERQVNELRSNSLSAENDLRFKSEALSMAEKRKAEMLGHLEERDRKINHYLGNIRKIEEAHRCQLEQINSMQKDLESSKKEKRKIANKLKEVEAKLKDEETVRREAENSVLKANQIIEKMQLGVREDYDKFQMLNIKAFKLDENLKERELVIQNLKRELDIERNTNNRLGAEIQNIPYYNKKIDELEREKRTYSQVIDSLFTMVSKNGLVEQYIPPPGFAEKFPALSEAIGMHASGDNDLHIEEKSVPPQSTVHSKSIPQRFSNPLVEAGLQPETKQMRKSLPGNSVNVPVNAANSLQPETRRISALGNSANSPSFNIKASTIIASDKNANQSNLEINSNGLSSEFKGLNISKHSTARKHTDSKRSRLPVKS